MSGRELPAGWETIKLKKIAEVKYGKARPKTAGSVPVIGSSGTYAWTQAPLVDFPTIVIGRKGTAGECWLASEPCWPSDTTFYLVWRRGVEPFYIFAYLKLNKLSGEEAQTTLPSLQKGPLENIPIPLPPLEEQRQIVAILEQAEELRRLRAEADRLTEKILPSVFIQMFGDPRENPKGWEWKKLGDRKIVHIEMGQSPPSRTYNQTGEGLPFYQGKAEFGDLYPTPKKWCSEPSKIAEKDDVLISVRAPVGPVNLCPEKSCIGRGLAALRALEGLNYLYLLFYLRFTERQIASQSTGSTFPAITKTQLEAFPILLPPLELQRRFAEIAEDVHFNQQRQAEAGRALDALYQSLSAQAFTGQLTAQWREDQKARIRLSEQQLAILALLSTLAGRNIKRVLITALMKYLFLMQMEGKGRKLYRFISYKYGPFAREVYDDLEALKERGLISISMVESGAERERTEIAFHDIQQEDLEKLLQHLPAETRDSIKRIVDSYGGLSLNGLLDYVYEKYPEFAVRSER